jgi:hypothetical protein
MVVESGSECGRVYRCASAWGVWLLGVRQLDYCCILGAMALESALGIYGQDNDVDLLIFLSAGSRGACSRRTFNISTQNTWRYIYYYGYYRPATQGQRCQSKKSSLY